MRSPPKAFGRSPIDSAVTAVLARDGSRPNNYAAADEDTQSDFDAYLADNDLAGPTMAPPKPSVYPDGRNQGRPLA